MSSSVVTAKTRTARGTFGADALCGCCQAVPELVEGKAEDQTDKQRRENLA
jgi:hypothetical protein